MPKVTIYLPDDLAAQVKESGISVSPVCQRALEQEVRTMKATTIADEEIATAAKRLIAEEGKEITRARAEGSRDGNHWALRYASPAELRRMDALIQEHDYIGGVDELVPYYMGGQGAGRDEPAFESIHRWLFEDEGGLDYDEEAMSVYWEAFQDAAMEAYDKVQEAMRDASS